MKGNHTMSRNAFVVCTQRTPAGKIRGALATVKAGDLTAMAIKKCVEKSGVDPAEIDEVIVGNLFNYDYGDIARYALREAGLPDRVPGITIDRQCSSGVNAVAYAALLISAGYADIVLAGGVESYSQRPLMVANPETAFPGALTPLTKISVFLRPGEEFYTTMQTAEFLAQKYNLTREECDEFAYNSHVKAAAAWNDHRFDEQVFPVSVPQKKGDPIVFAVDECVRFEPSLEAMAKLKPVLGGVITAGNASPMNDGAAMVLVMSEAAMNRYHLEPLARVGAFAAEGVDPRYMGIGPVAATRKLLRQTGLSIDDFDLIELNEAFAAQSIPCVRELGLPAEKLKVNGGAIAIGHPNAASGGILTGRLVHEMKRRNAKRGLVTFCCGGGQGFSCIFER